MKFCSNKSNDVFLYPRVADALAQYNIKVFKDQLDFIVHGRWAEAESDIVLKAARALRPLINHILEGQSHDVEDGAGA